MPQDVNLSTPIASLNPNVNSVRCWLYPSWDNQTAEVAVAQCCYIHMQSFTGKNETGTLLLEGFLDTGDVPIMTYYNVSTFNQLLQVVFGGV